MAGSVIIIAERINGTRKRIGEALEKRDEALIREEAKKQVEAGADYIDVNGGRAGLDETETLRWLVDTVQDEVDVPLCLDSADPEALKAALARVKKTPIVNSINAEAKRIEGVLPLVAEKETGVIALCMEEGRMPEGVADRMAIAEKLAQAVKSAGVPMERVFFDPCVLAAATSPQQPGVVLETTREIRKAWPECHVVCGLSNVSFGMPQRSLLNRTFLAMLVACGGDAFIIDPTVVDVRATVAAADVLSGADEYGMNYLTAFREGKLTRRGGRG